jgi:hypothetical protein
MDAIRSNKFLALPSLIFLFIILYMGQGFLYPSGSLLPKISFLAYVLSAIILIISSIKYSDFKIGLFRYLSFFILLNSLYFTFSILFEYDDLKFRFFRSTLFTLLSFFVGYYLSLKYKISPKTLIALFVILLFLAITNFFRQGDLNEDIGILQNNLVYGIVMLFPFLFLIKNKFISLVLMSIMYFAVIWSFKRGGIITGSILLLVNMFYLIFNKSNYSKLAARDFKRLFILIMIIFIIIYFFNELFSNEIIITRFINIEDDRGSQREYIFKDIFFGWLNFDNLFHFLFGFGFLGSIIFTLNSTAHNDFIEVVSNFGILGMIIFLGIWYGLFKIIRNKNCDITSRYIVASVFLAWVIDSQYQQFYNSLYSFSMMLILGFVVGKEKYGILYGKK